MKKKYLGATLLTALAVTLTLSACGKDNGNNPVSAFPETDPQQLQDAGRSAEACQKESQPEDAVASDESKPTLSGPFVLSQSYLGTNVTLIYPDSANWGWISIKGDDAKAMFNALAVKTAQSEGNAVWLPAKTRRGYSVVCYEQAMRSTPENLEYACSLYIDYKAGTVSFQSNTIQTDKEVSDLSESYMGKNVTMLAPNHPAQFSVLSIEGEDARVLYDTLSTQAVESGGNLVWLPSNKKESRDMTCFETAKRETPEVKEYACSIYFSYRTGAIIPPSSN